MSEEQELAALGRLYKERHDLQRRVTAYEAEIRRAADRLTDAVAMLRLVPRAYESLTGSELADLPGGPQLQALVSEYRSERLRLQAVIVQLRGLGSDE